MTIGDVIRAYRERESLSQRQFALRCGLSNGYIAMLERNVNPSTGKPIEPGIIQVRSIAHAMGLTLDELVRMVDGNIRVSLRDDVKRIEDVEPYRVPLIGEVAAGVPILAEQHDGGYVKSPFDADFALTISGDSMTPTFLDGDLIYIRQQPDIDYDGQVAVVLLDDSATVKHVYKQPNGLLLVSDNPAYKPMFKAFTDYNVVSILGKVCGFTRMYKE